MRISRSLLADAALLLLAATVVVAAAAVVVRDPAPERTGDARGSLSSSDLGTAPSPAPEVVRALFIGSDLVAGPGENLATVVGEELGWDVTVSGVPGAGFVAGPPGETLFERVPRLLPGTRADAVVVLASAADGEALDGRVFGGRVQFVVSSLRRALPRAQIVLVGPVAAAPDAFALQREILTQVAARYGAVFVDPTGRRYAAAPGLLGPEGLPTPAGYQSLGSSLASDLRRVLPAPLVPKAAATP